ncbi:MAG: YbjQ family protein [Candidatus Aenigmatarchaeota archaeon]
MLFVTTETIPGATISKVLGVAKGNTIRARGLGGDISAGLKTLIGGEIEAYVKIMTEAREEAIERMKKDAKSMGADAIVNVRFSTSSIMQGASEILVYGTAVKLKK